MDALVAARPAMIASLDKSRDLLEGLGGDLEHIPQNPNRISR
ncbi:hypothetical protein [Hongsoonwoonella zoysiae]|nr:hypothetical protein [Hongsoonwoonella zoysiae]